MSSLECILCLRHFVQSGDQCQLSLLSIKDMQCLLYMCAARFLTAEHVYQICSLHCACMLMLSRKYGSCRAHVIVCPVTKQNKKTPLSVYGHWCCVCLCAHACMRVRVCHSCQHLLGVNLSPKFVNLYFPYAGRVFCFFAGTSSILNSNRHMWQWKEEAML